MLVGQRINGLLYSHFLAPSTEAPPLLVFLTSCKGLGLALHLVNKLQKREHSSAA